MGRAPAPPVLTSVGYHPLPPITQTSIERSNQ
jgi:hypothetical protein